MTRDLSGVEHNTKDHGGNMEMFQWSFNIHVLS